jgi:hypothetical protein
MGTEFAFHPGKISAPTDAMIFRYSLTEESIGGSMRRFRTGGGVATDDAGTWAETVRHGDANACIASGTRQSAEGSSMSGGRPLRVWAARISATTIAVRLG